MLWRGGNTSRKPVEELANPLAARALPAWLPMYLAAVTSARGRSPAIAADPCPETDWATTESFIDPRPLVVNGNGRQKRLSFLASFCQICCWIGL